MSLGLGINTLYLRGSVRFHKREEKGSLYFFLDSTSEENTSLLLHVNVGRLSCQATLNSCVLILVSSSSFVDFFLCMYCKF
jgi:hypothetical protein